MPGKNLGIKTDIPSIGVVSNHPSFGQNQPQPAPIAQPSNVPPQNQPQQGGIPVIEIPWHKAGPDLKNIK
jgi:hypothetical protein